MASKDRDDDQLVAAAVAGWYRAGGRDHPNVAASEVIESHGLRYVVLWGGYGTPEALAVYRVRPDGVLRRMRRPPAELLKSAPTKPHKRR